jgi:hypothetical protein
MGLQPRLAVQGCLATVLTLSLEEKVPMPVPRNGFSLALAYGDNSVEKRASPRRPMLKQGRAVLSDNITISCIIRDMGAGGARLVFGGPLSLPPSFQLVLVSDDETVPVSLVWQRGFAAGVAFNRTRP